MKKVCLILLCCLLIVPTLTSAEKDIIKVPILMYHAVDYANGEYTNGLWVVSAKRLEEHISAIIEDGYTPIFLSELIDFVDKKKELPEKPICITFDDGYLDNYTCAFPLLKKYNCKATMFVVGSSIGKNTYKNTDYPINDHFGYDLANEMLKSGLVDIQSHTYDMHQRADYEGKEFAQTSILRTRGENVIEYIRKLKNDFNTMQNDINDNLNHKISVLAYPGGFYDNISELILRRMGIRVTLTTTYGVNYVEKGNIHSLYMLKRMNVDEYVSPEMLLRSLQGE